MRVLLVGARGQLGFELAPLLAAEHELIAPDRETLDLEAPGEAERFVVGARPDVVIVAAAMTDVDLAEREPALAWRINAGAPGEIARGCDVVGASLLHVSTDFVFAGTLGRPYVESDETGPRNVYGQTKLEGEQAVRAGCAATIVLRAAWVQSLRRPCFVTRMLERAGRAEVLAAAEDQRGSPTPASDLARALRDVVRVACAAPGRARDLAGIYHAACKGEATRLELTRAVLAHHPARASLCAQTVVGRPASSFPVGAPRPLSTPLDSGALERTFGVRLPPWEEAIARMLARS